MQLKKENLKTAFSAPEFGHPNRPLKRPENVTNIIRLSKIILLQVYLLYNIIFYIQYYITTISPFTDLLPYFINTIKRTPVHYFLPLITFSLLIFACQFLLN